MRIFPLDLSQAKNLSVMALKVEPVDWKSSSKQNIATERKENRVASNVM